MPALLPVHIIAGGLAIGLGAAALIARKGAWLHRKTGLLFVAAMITMGLSGSALALRHGADPNAVGGFMSVYLVSMGLMTVRPPSRGARGLAIGAMVLGFVLGLLNFVLGCVALSRGTLAGVPAPPYFIFALVGLLGSYGDLRVLRGGVSRGAPRLARHLWRMCLALFIAAASFFSIRARVAKVLPEPFLNGYARTLPIVLILGAMLYWLWRIRARTKHGMRWADAQRTRDSM